MSDASVEAPVSRTERARPAPIVKATLAWTRQEFLLLVREPVAVFFSLAFPVVIYVFIGLPYADEVVAPGIRFIDVVFPALLGTVSANLLLMGLPIYLAELRSRDVVKRYRSLPLPGAVFAVAVVVSMLALVVLASALVVGLVATTSGLRAAAGSWLFLAMNVAFVLALCPIGFFLGTLPLSARTVQALTAAVFFVLFFGSGAAAPLEGLPDLMQRVLEWNPLKIWFDALVAIYTGQPIASFERLKLGLTVGASVLAFVAGLASWKRAS